MLMPAGNRRPVSAPVLVVDDDTTTTRVLEGLLRNAGFDAVSTHNVADAERYALNHPVSLILLDVHLPDGNGLDLCAKLVSENATAGIPVLLISANDDLSTKIRGFSVGAVDYITKPLAGAEVLARVRTHLRLRRAYDSLVELQAERVQQLASTQQSLMPLPDDLPAAAFQVSLRQVLHAGGDFYDVIPSGIRMMDYVVADASGHDFGTALWTASFKALLAEYASNLHSPQQICRMLNTSLRRVLPEAMYFTAIYARLNRGGNKLMLVNAGHPSAILYSGREGCARVLPQNGDVIGAFQDAAFDLLEVPVLPGDRLFLYTDGLIEMDGDREVGMARLEAACNSTGSLPLAAAVTTVVDTMIAGRTPADDIVLLGCCV